MSRPWTPRRLLAANGALFLGYWGLSHGTWLIARDFGIPPMALWPAASLALAYALLWGWRVAPGIFFGTVAANAVSFGSPLAMALGLGASNTLAPLLAAMLLRRVCAPHPCLFRSPRCVLRFLFLGVGVQALVSATGASLVSWAAGADQAWEGRWLELALANASGALLLAPAILQWAYAPRLRLAQGHGGELLAVGGGGLAATAIVYFGWGDSPEALLGFPLLLSAPVLWIALRFSVREVVSYVPLAASLIVVAMLAHGAEQMRAGDPQSLVTAELIVLTYMMIGLVLGASVEEGRRGRARLLKVHEALEQANDALSRSLADSRRLDEIIGAAHDLVASADGEGRLTFLNSSGRKLLGIGADEDITRLRIADAHAPEVAQRVLTTAIPRAIAVGHWEGENEFRARDGTLIPMSQIIVAHRDTAGRIVQLSTIARDIRQRRKAEEELWLAASVFDVATEGITVTDADGIILAVNPAFTRITGFTAEEAVGRKPSVMKSEHHDNDFYRAMWATLLQKGHWEGEVWNRRKDGAAFLAAQNITMVPDAAGRPARYVAVFSDITESRRQEEHIRHLAFHDPLTDLPNRALFTDRLERAVAKAMRQDSSFALLFLDLDRFKNINDSLGHDVGDKLLREVARRLEDSLRRMDTVARLGGDEFVVLLDELSSDDDAVLVAEKIVGSLLEPVRVNNHMLHVTTSIGIALYPQDGLDAQAMMKNADTALYSAKAAGRNQYRFFSPAMNESAHRRLRLENDLRTAVREGQFELFYQPKICLRAGSPCGVEALIRWRHPEHGLVPPDEFIALAEETGLIEPIGDWVIDEAARQAAVWRGWGWKQFAIAVNVSAHQLRDTFLVATVAAACERHGIEPSLLQIELTESALMEDPEGVAEVLRPLRELGIAIAVDDFGTGYSSLAYLRRLPIDILKVDRSFVRDAEHDEDDAAIVRTIVALAHTLRLSVVAEGVETEAQAALLKKLGCQFAQGYLFARPMPAGEFERWLAANAPQGESCGLDKAKAVA